jgi:hypothetical protein
VTSKKPCQQFDTVEAERHVYLGVDATIIVMMLIGIKNYLLIHVASAMPLGRLDTSAAEESTGGR